MNIDVVDLAYVLGLLTSALTLVAFFVARSLWRTAKLELEYMRHPRLVRYNHSQTCEESHKWVEVELALRDLPPGVYKVCSECGAIAKIDFWMLSNEALDQIRESINLRAQRAALDTMLEERIKKVYESYLRRYVSTEFAAVIQFDPELNERLVDLAYYSQLALKDATNKIKAEYEAGVYDAVLSESKNNTTS